MYEASVPVETLLSRYFVRYNVLDRLIPVAFKGYKNNVLNIYIDIYGIYKTVFSRTYRTDISDYTAFTTTIINMCAHYRSYFKWIQVKTNIFLISSYNIPEINSRFVAGYNKTFKEKLKNTQVGEMVDLNCQLLELLCPYLPDIHFLKTSYESSVLIHHLIQKEMANGNNNPNMIISSDIYPMQLCSIFDHTIFLKPRKIKNGDASLITTPKGSETFNHDFWRIVSLERDGLALNGSKVTISPSNYMLLMALSRFPERNLYSIVNFTTAISLVGSVVGNEDIKINVDQLYSAIPELYNRYPKETFESRFKTLDLNYQLHLFEEDIESKMIHYENLDDPDAVRMVNAQYFEENPIDIFRL